MMDCRFISGFVLLCMFGIASVASAALPEGIGELIWSDEFDGTSLDSTKWAYYPWSSRHDARVSRNAVSVSDGVLNMQVYTQNGQHYTGYIMTAERAYNGGAVTDYLFSTTYGYFEVRAKFKSLPGMWSAFWITSATIGKPVGDAENAGTEIDVVEHLAMNYNTPVTDRYQAAIHWDGYGSSHKQANKLSPSLGIDSESWHTYGVHWTPDGYDFYFDGQIIWSAPDSVPVSNAAQYLLLSSEVKDNSWAGSIPGGGYGSKADNDTYMQVDYVRVYNYAPEPTSLCLLAPGLVAFMRRTHP